MPSTVGLVAVLVVGLVAGAAIGYGVFASSPGRPNVVTTTITVATTSTATATSSGINLQAALNNTSKPKLAVTSYSFGKGVLTAWVLNNGSQPYVIGSRVPLLNGSTDSIASVISTDSTVTKIGNYFYVPPGGTVIVTVDASKFLTGQTGVLSIYGDSWAFLYGTSKD